MKKTGISKNHVVIDLTVTASNVASKEKKQAINAPIASVASNLVESRVCCLKEEKDAYLYYFISKFPGRTIVGVMHSTSLSRFS